MALVLSHSSKAAFPVESASFAADKSAVGITGSPDPSTGGSTVGRQLSAASTLGANLVEDPSEPKVRPLSEGRPHSLAPKCRGMKTQPAHSCSGSSEGLSCPTGHCKSGSHLCWNCAPALCPLPVLLPELPPTGTELKSSPQENLLASLSSQSLLNRDPSL